MKFLVTGGEGFIGSKLCVELIKNDHEVTIINKKIDVSNIENTNNYYKDIDVVIHLASVSNIQDSISNPLSSVINNINMTSAALENAKRNGVKKFIFASTSSIYGNNPTPHREYMKPDILNPYSMSKYIGEEFCKFYNKEHSLKTIILRYATVYGENQPYENETYPLFTVFKNKKMANLPLEIFGDGSQKRDFVHVSDVVSATILASIIDLPRDSYGQIYNVGGNKSLKIKEIADKISSNQTQQKEVYGRSKETLLDNTKTLLTFGWSPKINIMDWISNEF